MKRPAPDASRNSWEAIWFATMDAKWPVRNTGTKSTEADDYARPKKIRNSLHQRSCGHDYAIEEYARVHPGLKYYPLGTELGCTPSEYHEKLRSKHK